MTALVSRSAVLVTGMSGTGKSTALAQLGRRGHRIVDTDDPGWIVRVEAPHGVEPMWDLDRVGALLEEHRAGWLFVSGCVANQSVLYNRFDAVVARGDRRRRRRAPGERLDARDELGERERLAVGIIVWPDPAPEHRATQVVGIHGLTTDGRAGAQGPLSASPE